MPIERKNETTFEIDGRDTLIVHVGATEVKIASIPQQGDPRVEVTIHYPDARILTLDLSHEDFQAVVRPCINTPRLVVSR